VGARRVRGEIRSFAGRYDPPSIHTDSEAAADGPFGGLLAIGWHTAAATMRPFVEGVLDGVAAVGGKGVDRLRWTDPVRPGDELSIRVEAVGTEAASPERGALRLAVETTAAAGRTVLSMEALALVRRRYRSPSTASSPRQ